MNARPVTVGVISTQIVPTKWGLAHVLAKLVLLETELPVMVSFFLFFFKYTQIVCIPVYLEMELPAMVSYFYSFFDDYTQIV